MEYYLVIKKELNNSISRDVDRPRDCQTEWNESKRKKSKYHILRHIFSSVTQLCLTLLPCGLQHTRLPCPLPTPGTCSNSCPSGQWCHPTISSFAVPFSSCLQSFPASGSFPVSQLFESGDQSIGASTSGLPMNIQDRFPLGLAGLISALYSKSQVHRFYLITPVPPKLITA